MNIVFFTRQKGRVASLNLNRARFAVLASSLIALPAVLIFGGYYYGQTVAHNNPDPVSEQLRAELEQQRGAVTVAVSEAERNMNALSRQLGRMQARVIRLDALGRRLTKMAKLEKGEFDFDAEPAQGGPESAAELQTPAVPDFLQDLGDLSRQLDSRGQQLRVLETMMMSRNLHEQAYPAGRPVEKSWVSSYFGMRNDPFTGKRELHSGVDFAGKEGSNVIAVADGVITWASDRYGYGNMVEITHGNGYTTRYGHSKEILVHVGDKVQKGDVLALMGSTGRSTGPHVHYEVLINGHAVDPNKHIHASR